MVDAGRDERIGVGCYFNAAPVPAFATMVCAGIYRDGVVVPLTVEREMAVPSNNDAQWFTAFLDLSSLDEGSYEVGLYYKGDDGLWSPMQAEQANASAFRLVIGTETVTMEKIHPDFRIALAEDFQPGILYTTGLKTWQLHITNPGAVRLEGWVGIRMQSEEAGVDTLFASLAYCEAGEDVTVNVLANLDGMAAVDYQLTPYYCSVNGIYAKPTVANSIYLGESVTVKATRKPLVSVMTPSDGFKLNRRDGSVTVEVSQPSSKIPFVGRIYAEIFRKTATGEETTGVKVYSGLLELTKPSVTDVTFWASETVDLPLGGGYNIVFYFDDGYATAFSSGSLTVVDEGSSVEEVEWASEVTYRRAEAQVTLCVPQAGQVSIISLSGMVVRNASLAAGIKTDISVKDLPSGLYFVRIGTGGHVQIKEIVIP